MATLKFEYHDNEFGIFNEFRKQFPEFRARTLGAIGGEGKDLLYQDFMRGQELDYVSGGKIDKDSYKDSRNIRAIYYSIGKRANYVKISSFPMNLFEKGRELRGGGRQPAKNVFKTKFKSRMLANLQGMINRFDKSILQDGLNKIAK